MNALLCVLVLEKLPRTTGTAASPQRRWSRYDFPAAYQTTDPQWDGPERETTSRLNTKNPMMHHIKFKSILNHLLHKFTYFYQNQGLLLSTCFHTKNLLRGCIQCKHQSLHVSCTLCNRAYSVHIWMQTCYV